MPQVLQSLAFVLLAGQSRPFLAFSRRAFDEFFCLQPGFLSMEILQAQDGRWFWMVRWQDPPSAQTADQVWARHTLRWELEDIVEQGSTESTQMLSIRYEEPEDTYIRH